VVGRSLLTFGNEELIRHWSADDECERSAAPPPKKEGPKNENCCFPEGLPNDLDYISVICGNRLPK
jgi:hypothetical protein